MVDKSENTASGMYQVPTRVIHVPDHISAIARMYLTPQPTSPGYPALDDKAAWRAYVDAVDASVLPLLQQMGAHATADVTELNSANAHVFDIVPPGLSPDDHSVVLEMHGGALILCGGEACKLMGIGAAVRFGRRTWSVNYRMPPEHPYPAALDDCIAAYRALLAERSPSEIIVSGGSASPIARLRNM